jgi:transcription elongation factor Elf1
MAMAFETWYSGGKRELSFSPSDFLQEAVEDFLESGAKTERIASAIIKVATGVELLLKNVLERICPALILDKVDDAGLQVAKVFGLGSRMRSPKELDTVELRTAAFPTLLVRASKFLDISQAAVHLHKLHKMRNSLIHHRGRVDVLEANLLLIEHVFPFLETLSKLEKTATVQLSADTWKRLTDVRSRSFDVLSSQLEKKLAHFQQSVKAFSSERVALLANSKPEPLTREEEVIEANLTCPACKQESLAAFQDIDVDFDETGPVAGHFIFSMRCRVCGLELDESEIAHIIEHFDQYFGADKQKELRYWKQSVEPDVPDDWY